jgi:hypothetical protein
MTNLPAWTRTAVGLVVAAAGAAITVLGALGSISRVGAAAGLVFVFGGVLVLLPERQAGARLAFGALMASSLAAVFGWVALGPGERHFTGSLAIGEGAARWADGELAGRIFFGLFALMSALAAIGLWIKYARVFFRANAPTDHG